jgi:hypothetical protein
MHSFLVRITLSCALSLTLATGAQAPNKASGDKDLEALQHYTLTMDKVNQYAQTFTDLGAYAKAHPDEAKKLSGDSDESLAAAEHRISAEPAIVAILAKHTFTPREFIVFGMALFQSAFAAETAKQNGIDPGKMAAEAHVNPANMTFVQQHKAELEAIMARMKEAAGKDGTDN